MTLMKPACHVVSPLGFVHLRAALSRVVKLEVLALGIVSQAFLQRPVAGFSECARQFPQYTLRTV